MDEDFSAAGGCQGSRPPEAAGTSGPSLTAPCRRNTKLPCDRRTTPQPAGQKSKLMLTGTWEDRGGSSRMPDRMPNDRVPLSHAHERPRSTAFWVLFLNGERMHDSA